MFMRPRRHGPIAIDFGAGSLKLVQTTGEVGRSVLAAHEQIAPGETEDDWDATLRWLTDAVPTALAESDFRGRRVLVGLPSQWTGVQHLQIDPEDLPHAETIAATSRSDAPDEQLTRIIHVGDFLRNDRMRSELISLSFPRHAIFGLVELLHTLGYDVVDLRTQIRAAVDAFAHLHRRSDDAAVATMYVDLGTSGTNCIVANGTDIVCARRITVGTRHIDRAIARHLGCDAESARDHRLAGAPAPSPSADAPTVPGERRGRGSPATLEDPIRPRDTGAHGIPEGDELLATIVDELRRAVRYDAGLFPERAIDRIVFLGAGAESDRVCRHIVQALQLPGQRADPVARHEPPAARSVPASWNGAALPAWTTTLGLLRPDRTRERRHAA
mgnify:CR=1 FL=1|tara:strand:- start:13029 stop:14186 length:1158 start_codon:yes stop_codon:yes gene_type:complete